MNINKQSKPQGRPEIKPQALTLDDAMARLAILVGSNKRADILRWLNVSPSSYNNWKRNDTVPVKQIAEAFFARGLSVDAFFRPKEMLKVPPELVLGEGSANYNKGENDNSYKQRAVAASLAAQTILKRTSLGDSQIAAELLIEMWLIDDGELLKRRDLVDVILNHLQRIERNVEHSNEHSTP
ncbi:hypothetical protein [Aliidiomarina celeris]|uniref:hypothetical protein n=1 Tax=Aliidiomarina celeris TaxID=2249428 RepID=UPI000DE8780C|nr:hypothetical protein [Aliidiomarina celeris]